MSNTTQKRLFWTDPTTGTKTPLLAYQIDPEAISELQISKQNKNDNSLDTTSKNIVGAINEIKTSNDRKIQTPTSPGVPGQVLTIDEDNSLIWKTPDIGGIEIATVQLSVDSGSGDVRNVPISVMVEGENEPRSLVTDQTGKVSFNVSFGLSYTVSFGSIQGYLPVTSLTYRASLLTRLIYGVYKEDIMVTQEHVRVELGYTTSSIPHASSLNVQTSAGTASYTIVNDVCEFDVPLGTAYTIKFIDVEGYSTPASQSYTATFHQRIVKTGYYGVVIGVTWIKASDGSSVALDAITLANCTEMVGLRISTSLLGQQNAAFIIPIEYLINGNITDGSTTLITAKSVGSQQWCSSNVLFYDLPCYTSESACLTSDNYRNFDGENNTMVYLAEATRRGISLPAFTTVQGISYEINGITKNCFLGSYAQMKAFADNYNNINAVLQGIFGIGCIAIRSGYWWCSTQYSAYYAVILGSGGFLNGIKYGSNSVVPFLAY